MKTILSTALIVAGLFSGAAGAQTPVPDSRTAALEQAQAQKATELKPHEPDKVEHILNRIEKRLFTGGFRFHPFFDSAYAGGGFTLGLGYARHVSSYNVLDVRGSVTLSGYKRVEAEFIAPRLFDRRGSMTLIGGWREATEVGFYGIGTANTSKDDRVNYSFEQPYAAATVDVWPTRKLLLLRGGLEVSQWNTGPGTGAAPPVDERYTPETLPGLGASPKYLHSQGTVAIDTRAFPGYARRGGFYGVTYHDFHDQRGQSGFRQTDVELIQHVPILREAWVLSLRGRVQLAEAAGGEAVPYFMLPALGGGSSLRGFSSWRFRDLNSLLLQAEWRVVASRFLDLALFYDAGRVAARRGDLTDGPLKSDYGIGFRLHGLAVTPLRIELAKSNEGLGLVFASKASF